MPFLKRISLYWKCQIFGWGLCSLFWMFTIPFYNNDFSLEVWLIALKGIFSGIFCSHLMKLAIIKWNIIEQPLWRQFVFLLLITIPFGVILIFIDGTDYLSNNKFGYFIAISRTSRIFYNSLIKMRYTFGLLFIWNLIYFLYKYIKNLKKEIQKGADMKIGLLELESKALRAQMNPHFIFNCMNSIKSLIQQDEKEKSITYLTTFSKLIRSLFNNADKKEITLYDEIETCKLYLQLETMRFDAKFSYVVQVDESIDLKSVQIPALIIQPFIENAVWHGIMPHNNSGHLSLSVLQKENSIQIIVDDDGIGRAASLQSKSTSNLMHQSKGVNLTQSRLELNNLLQQRQAKLQIIDKKDEQAKATGTTVIIEIKEELQ